MQRLLIAGIDSVAGSNLAASLAGQHHVVGLSFSVPIVIDGCETAVCLKQNADSVRKWVAAVHPDVLVHCGLADSTLWQRPQPNLGKRSQLDVYQSWANCAREFNSLFTLISSDAVFSGPWMFHKEESRCYCESQEATLIREIENCVREAHRASLLVRTCAYGWAPEATGPSWIEETLVKLEKKEAGAFDSQHYATPILATDLADILSRAWQAGLHGLYHVAGAERVNQLRFAELLAERFNLPVPMPVRALSLDERPTGFGRGETSLHTTKIRKALGVSMPMLGEGLRRLREQSRNGYCDRLKRTPELISEKVA